MNDQEKKTMFVLIKLPKRKVNGVYAKKDEAEWFAKFFGMTEGVGFENYTIEEQPFNDYIWNMHGVSLGSVPGSACAPEAAKCPKCGNGDCEECTPCEYCGEWDCDGDCSEANEAHCGCVDDYICDHCRELKREARWERAIEAYEDERFERTGKYY